MWHFENSTITCIVDRLASANIDIIEVGSLDDRQLFNIDITIQPNSKSYNFVLSNIAKKMPCFLL